MNQSRKSAFLGCDNLLTLHFWNVPLDHSVIPFWVFFSCLRKRMLIWSTVCLFLCRSSLFWRVGISNLLALGQRPGLRFCECGWLRKTPKKLEKIENRSQSYHYLLLSLTFIHHGEWLRIIHDNYFQCENSERSKAFAYTISTFLPLIYH